MSPKSFIYYGFDRNTYYHCIDMIRSTNRKHAIIMTTWFLIINVIYMTFSATNIMGVTQEEIPFYAAYTIVAILFSLALKFLPQLTERRSALITYTSTITLMSYGILNSIAHPYMPATMYLVLFMLASLLYIGNMPNTIFLALASNVAFVATSFRFKTFSIAYSDTYNALIISVISIGLHYMFQRTRISQFELLHRNLQIQQELEVKSSFDSLTGLLNRGRFFSISEAILRKCGGEFKVLCLVDLDGFKQINDKLGHQMGDKVIQTTGSTIKSALDIEKEWGKDRQTSKWDLTRRISVAGRLGGDEFILLLRGKDTRAELEAVLEHLLSALNAVKFDGVNGIRASIGATEIRDGEFDMDDAYSRADDALYESKRSGKNAIHFHEDKEQMQ